MGKKHQHRQFPKPSTTTHPSLSRSATSTSPPPAASSTNGSRSVNELLSESRRTAPNKVDRQAVTAVVTAPTVHPSVKALLGLPQTPTPKPRQAKTDAYGRVRGRTPGPPPPASWLSIIPHTYSSRYGEDRAAPGASLDPTQQADLARLPGLNFPPKSSLVHLTLKSLAINWEWHVYRDQYYLATLSSNLKQLLLSYIAVYGPPFGITSESLRVIFAPETEVPGATGNDDITHLDLSGLLGVSITLKQLEQLLTTPRPAAEANVEASRPKSQESSELDSWESYADDDLSLDSLTLHAKPFPYLTHLSLARPHPTVSWSRFLSLAPHLATLTHLSLAYWPVPSLTPNSKTATTSSKFFPPVAYGGSDFYSAFEGDWSEAAGILRRLSRAIYCLKWLDLEGCNEWSGALNWKVQDEGAEWTGAWRGLDTLILGGAGSQLVQMAAPTVTSDLESDSDRSPVYIYLKSGRRLKSKLGDRQAEVVRWVTQERKAVQASVPTFYIRTNDD